MFTTAAVNQLVNTHEGTTAKSAMPCSLLRPGITWICLSLPSARKDRAQQASTFTARSSCCTSSTNAGKVCACVCEGEREAILTLPTTKLLCVCVGGGGGIFHPASPW